MPPAATKSKYAKISKSYIVTPPQGHVMSVKCEEPIDELTVKVWLLYHHPNFKYCTLFVSGTELRTDRQTNKRTDGRSDYLMPPADLSGRGHKKGKEPGVRKGKHSLLACHTCCKCSMETTRNSVKVKLILRSWNRWKVWWVQKLL